MSLRNVRRLLNETNDISNADDNIDDEAILPAAKSRRKKNAVSKLLLAVADEDDEVDTRDDDDDVITSEDEEEEKVPEVIPRRKQNKQKKTKKMESDSNQESEDDEEDDVDIDETIAEVDRILGSRLEAEEKNEKKSKVKKSPRSNLLQVVNRNLNFYDEYQSMKQDEQRLALRTSCDNNPTRDTKRVKLQASKTRTKLAGKNWVFINPKKHSPIKNPGLSMNLIKESSSELHFEIVHSPKYQLVQLQFLEIMKAGSNFDSDKLIELLNENPNHVDSLIQASSIVSDPEMSFELIQRAILSYENILHHKFHPSNSLKLRINFKKPENRSLFICLFKYMIAMSSDSIKCYKTSLELSKLIFNLDPVNDPLSILLILDHLSLKSKNYEFLISFFNQFKNSKKLDKFPNFMFNTSLTLVLKSLQKQDRNQDVNQDRQSLFNQSNDLLQESILMFPTTLSLLCDSLGIEPDSRVKNCSYFDFGSILSSPIDSPVILNDLINLFVERNSKIWKDSDPSILTWLETNVQIVISRLEADSYLSSTYDEKRRNFYLSLITPRNVLRHVLLCKMKKVKLPLDITEESKLAYDPIPPSDSLAYETRVSLPEPRDYGAAGASGGIIKSFFQSWIPSYSAPEKVSSETRQVVVVTRDRNQGRRNQIGDRNQIEHGNQNPRNDNQAEDASHVMAAMRDFLNNISFGLEGGDEDQG